MPKNNLEKALNSIENMSDEEFDKMFQSIMKEEPISEEKFNSLLEFLIKYTDEHKRVLSDEFYYEEEKCQPYTFREFEDFLNSLFNKVYDYAKRNCITTSFFDEGHMFCESSCCVKIKNKFYMIQLIVGQGSYIDFSLLEKKNIKINTYVNYENIISGNGENKRKKVSSTIISNLDKMKADMNIEDDVFNDILEEYINR